MRLGVFTTLLSQKSLDESLRYLSSIGVTDVEIGVGGYPGNAHANPNELLYSEAALSEFKETIQRYNMNISALSVHGNPVHPQKEIAQSYHEDFEKAVLLAEKLDVDTIITFSGCPGDSEQSKYPNWVTCPWPDDFSTILEYQWNEVLIPYWKQAVQFANEHGVTKIALEMHPGFCVYNPESLLKLRKAVGDTIGANFDPSHLIWQGMDIPLAIRELQGAIHCFHAKDTNIDEFNTKRNGVLDVKHYGDELNRSWVFRTVGYGNDTKYWKDIISTLRLVGYDGTVSIEHEDSLMSTNEGLEKAVSFLQDVLIHEERGTLFWA